MTHLSESDKNGNPVFVMWQKIVPCGQFRFDFFVVGRKLLVFKFEHYYWGQNLGETIGPIFDDKLKEKILKPWKGALSSHYVCVSVRPSVCPSVC